MTFKDLLEDCEIPKIIKLWDSYYDNFEYDSNPSDFIPEYIEYLKILNPVKSDEFEIVITTEKDFDENDFIVVNGKSKNSEDSESYAMELSTNEEWLGFDIVDNLNLSKEEIITHILWEMSFCGLSNEERKKIQDELDRRVKDIKKWEDEGTLDKHTYSIEEVMSKIDNKFT